MKNTTWILCLILLFSACKEYPFSYNVPDRAIREISGKLWKEVDAPFCYTDVQITDLYYVFADYENNTLHIYNKDIPSAPIAYGLTGNEPINFTSIEFLKSNTRYPSEKEDIWLVDNKTVLKQITCKDNMISLKQEIRLGGARGSSYNFTPEEQYAVPTYGNQNNAFYFFRPDSGHYWVEMQGIPASPYKKNAHAFSSYLVVNEQKNATACSFRFFNQIHFYDLRGNTTRIVTVGEEEIKPQNKTDKTANYLESYKCFIDSYGTSQYVYCVYDGSLDFSKKSQIMVFTWDGKHVKTLQADHIIKKIAVDLSDQYFIAITANNEGKRDVMRYELD